MIHAIYHWWGSSNDAPPYANLRAPILLSIATLRAVSDIPITVLDMTFENGKPVHNDWRHFPEKLDFKVTKSPFWHERFKEKIPGYRHLSRIMDVKFEALNDHNHDVTIMYVDSDVFFLRNPLPLRGNPNKFCFNGWNTGLFYHQMNDPKNREFYEIFETYTNAAIYSDDIRRVMKTHVNYEAWYGVWDEMILTYMNHQHPELFSIIPVEEHVTAKTISFADLSKVKAFHANGTMMANDFPKNWGEKDHCRGLLCLIIKEFYDNICKVLSEEDMKLIFTEVERRNYIPQQLSLLENVGRLESIKGGDGHFHMWKWMRPRHMIM
jgi:hypothetical protein